MTSPGPFCFRLPLLVALSCLLLAAGAVKTTNAANPRVHAEAFSAVPFGVGRLVVQFDQVPSLPAQSPLWLREKEGRTHYPVFAQSRLRGPLPGADSGPGELVAYFLVQGQAPLELTLETMAGSFGARAQVQENPAQASELLDAWWKRYAGAAKQVAASNAYPPLVENYLTTMLARRLGKQPPQLSLSFSPDHRVDKVFAVMTGAESVRIAAQSGVLLRQADYYQTADQPLPTPVAPPPVQLPGPADGQVEDLAFHVPQECFYIRAASIDDLVWLHRLLDRWGGKITSLASIRAVDYGIRSRLEKRLGLREERLLATLKKGVLSDMAVIGTDALLRQGPAVAVLLEAKESGWLTTILREEQAHILKTVPKAIRTTEQILGRRVSLIATPGNQVRSFYAVDGKYHLISTSRQLVKRFFEAGQGERCLGKLDEFRWARRVAPLSEQRDLFVYLSDPFFRNLVSPHYRIAMTRRLRAETEIELAYLARWAAEAEGHSAKGIVELMKAGYLPSSFEQRPGGGQVLWDEQAVAYADSQWGDRGAFLPIPDHEVAPVTPAEVKSYQEFSQLYRQQWRRMDPAILQITRRKLDEKTERVSVDLHVTPYARQHYQQLAGILSAPDRQKWKMPQEMLASLQVNLWGKKVALGLHDFAWQFAVVEGKVHHSTDLQDAPLVAVSDSDALAIWVNPSLSNLAKPGIHKVSIPLIRDQCWLRRMPHADVLSPNKELIGANTFSVFREDTSREAQIRLRVGDLSGTQLGAVVHAEGYTRARRISAGNVAMLHTLMGQLRIPVNEATEAAARLLDGRPLCPLGGDYEQVQGFSSFPRWHSTAFAQESLEAESRVPKGFRTPLLEWLAGLSLDFQIDRTSLHTHLELDLRESVRE